MVEVQRWRGASCTDDAPRWTQDEWSSTRRRGQSDYAGSVEQTLIQGIKMDSRQTESSSSRVCDMPSNSDWLTAATRPLPVTPTLILLAWNGWLYSLNDGCVGLGGIGDTPHTHTNNGYGVNVWIYGLYLWRYFPPTSLLFSSFVFFFA